MAFAALLFFPVRDALAAYRVGPGDVLELTVSQEPRLTGKFTVDEEGRLELDVDLLGDVAVAGESPEQIGRQLTEALKRYLKAPAVRVTVAEYRSQKVYVLGAVAHPGSYILQGEKNLLDVVLDAGGTGPGAEGRLLVMRGQEGGGDTVSVDMSRLLAGGAAGPLNMKLAAGDMILVPGVASAEGAAAGQVVEGSEAQVTVVGEVSHPGIFRLEPGGTALSAVLAAGGLTKYASPNRSKVVRMKEKGGRDVFTLELGDVMKHGEKNKDIVLVPGDMVIIPARIF